MNVVMFMPKALRTDQGQPSLTLVIPDVRGIDTIVTQK